MTGGSSLIGAKASKPDGTTISLWAVQAVKKAKQRNPFTFLLKGSRILSHESNSAKKELFDPIDQIINHILLNCPENIKTTVTREFLQSAAADEHIFEELQPNTIEINHLRFI
ncbi:MAG: hypothetical protein CMK59_01190 [Proteobacteria bacterium]|nr:hypothetical protein [Pseudomonadota bacterium]|tara:strand:- start:286 stop:624 length:339 start_codon:yes stop_codon:yes gene_type:complete